MRDKSLALLSHPAYRARVRLRGYNHAVSAAGAVSARDAANVLITANPAWTRQDHRRIAHEHQQAEAYRRRAWGEEADAAAQEAFARPYRFTDYRVSGIACEEFSDSHKAMLREHAHSASAHSALAAAHRAAAHSRRLPA